MNSVILEGSIATEIRLDYVGQKKTAKASFNLLVDDEKNRQDAVPVVAWGSMAEEIINSCNVGDVIEVRGKVAVARWNDKETQKPRSKVDVMAFEWTLISQAPLGEETQVSDEDVPF